MTNKEEMRLQFLEKVILNTMHHNGGRVDTKDVDAAMELYDKHASKEQITNLKGYDSAGNLRMSITYPKGTIEVFGVEK